MEIRKYQDKDKENLRKICIATAPSQKSKKGEKLLTLLYNDYYTECESDNCFVLTDENDDAVGYIICAQNFDAYRDTFMEKYLPQVKKLSFFKYLEKKLSLRTFEAKYSVGYPAHLHIDILPGFTGKGSGSRLIEALLSQLCKKNVPGVMLGVGIKNTRAIKFYKGNGFWELVTVPGMCVFMGKKLTPGEKPCIN